VFLILGFNSFVFHHPVGKIKAVTFGDEDGQRFQTSSLNPLSWKMLV
jgi:hypothetical protein